MPSWQRSIRSNTAALTQAPEDKKLGAASNAQWTNPTHQCRKWNAWVAHALTRRSSPRWLVPWGRRYTDAMPSKSATPGKSASSGKASASRSSKSAAGCALTSAERPARGGATGQLLDVQKRFDANSIAAGPKARIHRALVSGRFLPSAATFLDLPPVVTGQAALELGKKAGLLTATGQLSKRFR